MAGIAFEILVTGQSKEVTNVSNDLRAGFSAKHYVHGQTRIVRRGKSEGGKIRRDDTRKC